MNPPPTMQCGLKQQRPGYRFRTRCYDHFQLIAVRSGRLLGEWQGGRRKLGPNTLLLLPPGSAFTLWCDREGYTGLGINTAAWEGCPADPVALEGEAPVRQLAGLLEGVLQAAEPGSADLAQFLGSALCAWVVRLATQPPRGEGGGPSDYWAERIRQVIENHLGSEKTLAEILRSLGLSYRQGARHFAAHFGVSPKRYQILRRVEEARWLLQTTRWPVTSIALELGFGDSQHLATRFRRMTGQSPSAVRGAQRGAGRRRDVF